MVVTMACSDRDETHWICLGCHAALIRAFFLKEGLARRWRSIVIVVTTCISVTNVTTKHRNRIIGDLQFGPRVARIRTFVELNKLTMCTRYSSYTAHSSRLWSFILVDSLDVQGNSKMTLIMMCPLSWRMALDATTQPITATCVSSPIGDALPLKKCGHRLHATCLEKHFVQECPVCRTPQTDVTVERYSSSPRYSRRTTTRDCSIGGITRCISYNPVIMPRKMETIQGHLVTTMNGQASAREIYAAEVVSRRAKVWRHSYRSPSGV